LETAKEDTFLLKLFYNCKKAHFMKLIFAFNIERSGVEAETTVQTLLYHLFFETYRVKRREDGRERELIL